MIPSVRNLVKFGTTFSSKEVVRLGDLKAKILRNLTTNELLKSLVVVSFIRVRTDIRSLRF